MLSTMLHSVFVSPQWIAKEYCCKKRVWKKENAVYYAKQYFNLERILEVEKIMGMNVSDEVQLDECLDYGILINVGSMILDVPFLFYAL